MSDSSASPSASETLTFELARLAQYDDDSIIAELQRVAALVPTGRSITVQFFDQHSKVHSSTVRGRFRGWKNALTIAGLEDRYSGRSVSEKMRTQVARGLDASDLIAELQRVATEVGSRTLTQAQFNRHSMIAASAVTTRFGSWSDALSTAGLSPVPGGRRYSEEDYFENLLTVWTHYGRQPSYGQMNLPPSRITAGGYEHRFGGWTKALVAFVEYVNRDKAETEPTDGQAPGELLATPRRHQPALISPRQMSVGLRYDILRRDNFKCSICGRSPATHAGCVLHVDHVVPLSTGGTTTKENLRSLCADCNMGKGAKT